MGYKVSIFLGTVTVSANNSNNFACIGVAAQFQSRDATPSQQILEIHRFEINSKSLDSSTCATVLSPAVISKSWDPIKR